MNVRNCRKCGRLFNYLSGPPICQNCKDSMEETFQKTKEFIRENRNANIQEVSEACEVEINQIKQWIREERLEFSDDSAIGLDCEKCGAIIRSGRFCEKCKAEMVNTLSSTLPKPKVKSAEPAMKPKRDEKGKMRFLE